MKQDVTHISKYCPGSKLSLGQCRVKHNTDATSTKDDWNEEYVLKVGKEVNQFLTVELDEVRVLDPDIFFHLSIR
jgi:hypothetical protein